jgi:hypothetical protein
MSVKVQKIIRGFDKAIHETQGEVFDRSGGVGSPDDMQGWEFNQAHQFQEGAATTTTTHRRQPRQSTTTDNDTGNDSDKSPRIEIIHQHI